MGLLDSLIEWLGLRRREANVLVVGLDNSGKTSLLNILRPQDAQTSNIVPTVGFSVEHFTCYGLSLNAFDMSGQSRYRHLWANYYRDAHGIIFVLDSSDKGRIMIAREELHQLLSHPDLAKRHVPILIFANKMDIRDALSDIGVSSALSLESIANRSWHVCSSNALTGEGVITGVEWLSIAIKAAIEQGRK